MKIETIIRILPLFFIAIAAMASLRAFVFNLSLSLKLFSALWFVVLGVEIAGHASQYLGIPNHWLYNIFDFVFFPFLLLIYERQLLHPKLKRVIRYLIPAFVLFCIINTLYIQDLSSLQTLTIVIGGSLIFFTSVSYFWQLYASDDHHPITRDPFFWLSFGLIVYFGGTVPFLGMLNYLWTNFKDFTTFYFTYFSNVFSILLNIMIAIGFLCQRNSPKSS